ncbi:MAG: helix-turn-helix domain-containing protein [Gammaproteobacteria bacterium]|nr:helix-turn-helix domain-containing protein [Gammaproteobacteria bacterium]
MTAPMTAPTTAGRGRPRGESDARQLLIAAARHQFAQRPFDAVSTRALATEAGVDAALIRYYFRSKAGLFEQMLRETLEPVLTRLADKAPARAQDGLETLMRTYYRIMVPNPGVPRLIQRVLHDDPQTESYRILQGIFEEILTVSMGWLQTILVDSGHMRKELDPKLARLSFVSLMVFPLVAPPLLITSSGLSMSEADIDRLVTHNVDILQRALLRHTESETETEHTS